MKDQITLPMISDYKTPADLPSGTNLEKNKQQTVTFSSF